MTRLCIQIIYKLNKYIILNSYYKIFLSRYSSWQAVEHNGAILPD